jgi:hypothetical protein
MPVWAPLDPFQADFSYLDASQQIAGLSVGRHSAMISLFNDGPTWRR